MNITKLASSCFNLIVAGLEGYNTTFNIPIELLEDEVCETKLQVIRAYYLKNILPKLELAYTLNCIEVDCGPITKCCSAMGIETNMPHFTIPPIATACDEDAVLWIGSTDKQIKFKVYMGPSFRFHKYRTRRKNFPYVYIDTSVNSDGLLDCYLFNAPLLERISVTAIFADDRKLVNYDCCSGASENVMTSIDTEVKDKVVKKYFTFFRLYQQQPRLNDQNAL